MIFSARLYRYAYPLKALFQRDLRVRYAPTVFGIGWTVLHPLVLLLMYTFVFSVIFKVRFDAEGSVVGSALYLVCGFLPYTAIAEGIHLAGSSLSENKSLLKKTIFPTEILPVVSVFISTIPELIGLFLLLIFAGIKGIQFSILLAFLPLLILIRIVFTMGLAWLSSVLNVYIKDMRHITGLLITAWGFLTPIYYPVQMMPDNLKWLLKINPLFYLTDAYRAVIMEARNPLYDLPVLVIWAVMASLGGLWFFRRTIDPAKDFL